MNDEFYVGYFPSAPPKLARRSRVLVIILIGVAGIVTASLAAIQRPHPPGLFEFGMVRTFEGILWEKPLPVLEIAGLEIDTLNTLDSPQRLLLVGFGKTGLPEFARGHHGQRVRFDGTLIAHQRHSMIEMNDPDSFEVLKGGTTFEEQPETQQFGEISLKGELVDTKCYFGVMRPATGKVHRACAIRCLSGGIPPGLLVRDDRGGAVVYLLAGIDGPLDYDVEWAALEVQVRGSLEHHGSLRVIRARSLELGR